MMALLTVNLLVVDLLRIELLTVEILLIVLDSALECFKQEKLTQRQLGKYRNCAEHDFNQDSCMRSQFCQPMGRKNRPGRNA